MTDQDKEPGVILAQVYLDSVEFSHRADALLLPPNTKAEIGSVDVAVEIAVSVDEKSGYIKLTASTDPDAQPVYKVKLAMVGLVTTGHEPNIPIREYLIGSGLAMMYPFVREALANITQRGRFGPVWLNPINAKKVAEQFQPTPESKSPVAAPRTRKPRRPSALAQARALRDHKK